jgi:hypothetical protein
MLKEQQQADEDGQPPAIVVVLNWAGELRSRLPR